MNRILFSFLMGVCIVHGLASATTFMPMTMPQKVVTATDIVIGAVRDVVPRKIQQGGRVTDINVTIYYIVKGFHRGSDLLLEIPYLPGMPEFKKESIGEKFLFLLVQSEKPGVYTFVPFGIYPILKIPGSTLETIQIPHHEVGELLSESAFPLGVIPPVIPWKGEGGIALRGTPPDFLERTEQLTLDLKQEPEGTPPRFGGGAPLPQTKPRLNPHKDIPLLLEGGKVALAGFLYLLDQEIYGEVDKLGKAE